MQTPQSHTARTPGTGSALGLCLALKLGGPVPSLLSVDSGSAQPHIFTYCKPRSLLFAGSFRQTPECFACAFAPGRGQGEGPSPTRENTCHLVGTACLRGPAGRGPDPPSLVPTAAQLPDLGSRRQASPLPQLEGDPQPPTP